MRGRLLATAGVLLAPMLAWGDTPDDDSPEAPEQATLVVDVTVVSRTARVDPTPGQVDPVRPRRAAFGLTGAGRGFRQTSWQRRHLAGPPRAETPRASKTSPGIRYGSAPMNTPCRAYEAVRQNLVGRALDGTCSQTSQRGATLVLPSPPPEPRGA